MVIFLIKDDIEELERKYIEYSNKHTETMDKAKNIISQITGFDVFKFSVEVDLKEISVQFRESNPSSNIIGKIREEFGALDDSIERNNKIVFKFD